MQCQTFSNWLLLILPFLWQAPTTETHPEYAKRLEDQMRKDYHIVKNRQETRKKKDISRHNFIQK